MAEETISRFVRRLQFHSRLSAESVDAIAALPWRTARRGRQSYVLREGDAPKEVSVLVAGFAQRQKHTSDGTRQIVSFSIPGDPLDFDCLYLDEADFSIQFCTNATIICARKNAINALLDGKPEVSRAITSTLVADAAIFREWVVNTGRRDARRRIAHLLCELLMRARAQHIETDRFEMPFTQEQLADATGLTPVHVNRVLRQLSTEGILKRQGRFISVPDWDRLQDIADFDPRFLHFRRN